VIASLVYLATQIRHSRDQMGENTRALRAGTYQQFEQSLKTTMMSQLTTPDLHRIVVRGLVNHEQLTDEEMDRFRGIIYVTVRDLDNAHYQYRLGMFDEDRWQLSLGELRLFLQSPAFVEVWNEKGYVLSPEFVALVEEILAEEPDRGDEVGHVSVGAS
jgi:hypothetical protein